MAHALANESASDTSSSVRTEVGSGRLAFDAAGHLAASDATGLVVLSFDGAAPGQQVALDFGGSPGADLAGQLTELASASASFGTASDGSGLPEDPIVLASICQ